MVIRLERASTRSTSLTRRSPDHGVGRGRTNKRGDDDSVVGHQRAMLPTRTYTTVYYVPMGNWALATDVMTHVSIELFFSPNQR
jgi:hypothetical protein